MAWGKGQVKTFAKEWISMHARYLVHLGPQARSAFLSADVLRIVLGQDAETVRVADVEALLAELRTEVEAKLGSGFFED